MFFFSVPKTSEILVCNVPQYLLDLLDCVEQQNFVECPKFRDSKECKKLRKFVKNPETCNKNINGNLIVDFRIFEDAEVKE